MTEGMWLQTQSGKFLIDFMLVPPERRKSTKRFPHRVQQLLLCAFAADGYALLQDTSKAAVHLAIQRALLPFPNNHKPDELVSLLLKSANMMAMENRDEARRLLHESESRGRPTTFHEREESLERRARLVFARYAEHCSREKPTIQALIDQYGIFPADVIRDVVGNPFQPPVQHDSFSHPDVKALAWGAVSHSQDAQYEPVSLSILADALEENGCDDVPRMNTLRDGLPHHMGCWAVFDLLGLSQE